ncbi:thioredoxin domain-containing protein [Nocardia sp. NPDC050697]|uniref:DsbA family protein n=1 Tax=Nocardia sp. NPDC050697 TaxID=3155158 RepID=UPI0033FC16B8
MSKPSAGYTPRPMSSNTTYALGALAVVIIGLIVFAAYRWSSSGEDAVTRNDGYGSVRDTTVQVAIDGNAIRLGKPDARATVDIYEDPICPACGVLERIYGQEIAQRVDEGALAVRYHLVNFLDSRSSSGDYSSRAAGALRCVAQDGQAVVYARFHDALFLAEQPEESADSDHTADELAAIARTSGAPESSVQCIATGAQTDAARAAATANLEALRAISDKVGTPTVIANGNDVDVNNAEWVVELTR